MLYCNTGKYTKNCYFLKLKKYALDAQAKMVKYLFCLYLDYTEKKVKAITAVFYWNILLYLKADILKEFKKLYAQSEI